MSENSIMWNEVIKNEVWINKNLLEEQMLVELFNRCSGSEVFNMRPGEGIKDLFASIQINPTLYDYTVHRANLRAEGARFFKAYSNSLNQVFTLFGLSFSAVESLMPLQFFAKSFTKASFYDLHAEPTSRYGDWAFVHFLEDCDGGELVFPSQEELNRMTREGEGKKNFDATEKVFSVLSEKTRCIGSLEVTPSRNLCVLFRVGSYHYVKPPKGDLDQQRRSVTGWPFVSPELIEDLNRTCDLSHHFQGG